MSASMLDVVDGITAAIRREMTPDEIDLLHRLVSGTDYEMKTDWYVDRVLNAIGNKTEVADDQLRTVSYAADGRGGVREAGGSENKTGGGE